MCVCVCTCRHLNICACMSYLWMYMEACACVCICGCICTCGCVHICVCMCTHRHVCACLCSSMHVGVYMCMHVCMYTRGRVCVCVHVDMCIWGIKVRCLPLLLCTLILETGSLIEPRTHRVTNQWAPGILLALSCPPYPPALCLQEYITNTCPFTCVLKIWGQVLRPPEHLSRSCELFFSIRQLI